MVFVLVTTLVALFQITRSNFEKSKGLDFSLINSGMSIFLIILALYLVLTAFRKMFAVQTGKVKPSTF
jgi:hypothetical protein